MCTCGRDDDDIPGPPPPPKPDPPSWEKLGEPMRLTYLDRDLVINAAMLRAAADAFVPEEAVTTHAFAYERCLGWIERVEMRGDELWGFVRWTGARPAFGVAAVLETKSDVLAGVPRLRGAVVRLEVPGLAAISA